MKINDPVITRALKEETPSPEELYKHLLENYSAPHLARLLAEALIESQANQPILITMDELMAHFRVKGTKWADGQMVPDGRGSLRWKK